MKNVSINSAVGQQLAAIALTKKIRGTFNLWPHNFVKDIKGGAKEGIDPLEVVDYLEVVLPIMVTEFLSDLREILKKEKRLADKK